MATAEHSTKPEPHSLSNASSTTPSNPTNTSYSYEFIEFIPPYEELNAFDNKPEKTQTPTTVPGYSDNATEKPLEVEIIYVDSLPDPSGDVSAPKPPSSSVAKSAGSGQVGALNTVTYPEPTTELVPAKVAARAVEEDTRTNDRTERSLSPSSRNSPPQTVVVSFTEATKPPAADAAASQTNADDVTSPSRLPESAPSARRTPAPKIELHKDCKYQIILRTPDPESSESQECENALSTLVTSHDWALLVELRSSFGIFLGSAGGIRDTKIPSLRECSIQNVQKGVDELLKDPINKPLCVYVRAPVHRKDLRS